MYVVRRIVRRSTLNRNLDTAYVQYTATLQPRNTRPKNFNNRPTKNKEPQEFQQSEGTTDHSINNRRMYVRRVFVSARNDVRSTFGVGSVARSLVSRGFLQHAFFELD